MSEGLTIEAQDEETVLDACLRNGIKIKNMLVKNPVLALLVM